MGVLQLLNAQDPQTGARIPFDAHMEQMVESFATLAASVLELFWPLKEKAASG